MIDYILQQFNFVYMKRLTNLLVIGGTGRNIGKTTLVEILIDKFKNETGLIALKTSMLLPGDEYLHDQYKLVKSDEFELIEENVLTEKKKIVSDI